VPVSVRTVDGNGRCEVDVLGLPVRMRCARDQRVGVAASACLRGADLRIARGEPGVRVTLLRAIYQGGHFRLETSAATAPEVRFDLSAPEPFDAAAGSTLDLGIGDGWVIPGAAS
jgi:hypothetical protein